MDTLLMSPITERTTDKHFRVPWTRKNIPLKSSKLFNKVKHSEEWHQSIDASAASLHPSNPNFPYVFLQQRTDTYLKKKGKISQLDIDTRLLILINAHGVRDVAIAAAAPFMTVGSPALRALLHVDLNVMQGSYWGLEMWLQCLVAANHGNPATVTDLEALWARRTLPFATHGAAAAGRYLEGICKVLRECSTPNMGSVPEFATLTRRASIDFSLQLEGMRVRCHWVSANATVAWMRELARSEPTVTADGNLSPQQLLDSQFPAWRVWMNWTPDVKRIASLASMDSAKLNIIADLAALEGPDTITGRCCNLREGLVEQYGAVRSYVKYQGLVIEVLELTRDGLRKKLERMAGALDIVTARVGGDSAQESMFGMFTALIVDSPVTKEALDVFEATCWISCTPKNDIYNAVREIYAERDCIGGHNLAALRHLICGLAEQSAKHLRTILLQPWLAHGLGNCIAECRTAIRLHIEQRLDWIPLALEFHEFCVATSEFKRTFWLSEAGNISDLNLLPPIEKVKMVVEIYQTAQKELSECSSTSTKAVAKQLHQDSSTKGKEPIPKSLETARNPLEKIIEEYCLCTFDESGEFSDISQHILDLMLSIWETTSGPKIDIDRRSLALHMTMSLSSAHDLLIKCLTDIASPKDSTPQHTFYRDTLDLVREIGDESSKAIVAFIRLMIKTKPPSQCWRYVLYHWLQTNDEFGNSPQMNVLDYSLRSMKVSEWLSFMYNLETLFADFSYPVSTQGSRANQIPAILQKQLLSWKTQITKYEGTIKRLETQLGDDSIAVQYFLTGEESLWRKNLLSILETLSCVEGKPKEVLVQNVVGKLSATKNNGWEVADCVLNLLFASQEVLEPCTKIWDAKHGVLNIPGLPDESPSEQQPSSSKPDTLSQTASTQPSSSSQPATSSKTSTPEPEPRRNTVQMRNIPLSVVEVMLAGYVQSETLDLNSVILINSVADILEIQKHPATIPEQKLKEAFAFWTEIEREIVEEAERLEALQRALEKKDPRGTAALIQELGLPGNSVLDAELLDLPAGVINAVERVSNNEVEISFPLNELMDLQRRAMGIPSSANTLLLRLVLDEMGTELPSFCLHYDNDPKLGEFKHFPWSCSQNTAAPSVLTCRSPETAYAWQLNRALHRQITTKPISIVDLHGFVSESISSLTQSCVSCGTSHNASGTHLRRSTPCNLLSCTTLWYLLPLHVRIPEIRTDPFAVDLLLTSVFAAAQSARPELLPGCPIRGGNATVKSILNALPSMTVMRDAVNLSLVLRSYHKDAERLISWACVHFRGYLSTATGLCKVPNLPPGTHQFVLANASPSLETAFVSNLAAHGPKSNPKSTVLFHGTTPDRLIAILVRGLKNCSGTNLQRTGAAYGHGIYLAEDPAASFAYSAAALSWENSGLHNMKMLLGCEVAGSGRSVATGIHVLTDESAVMVRYVFLFCGNNVPPISGHMVPAMASGMRGLRMGTM